MNITQWFKIFFSLFFLILSLGLGALLFVANHQTVDFAVLENHRASMPSRLLDINGQEWARFALDRRDPVNLDQMPKHLIDAFIATEDWSFFTHAGLSWKGIVRSLVYNVYYGRKVQGASTITQQLVRMLFLDNEKTFTRKIVEQWYSILVEQQFTKEQILQTYLNNVYFGCGIYGVEAASQRFWGKSVGQLTIDECAVLAGIMRSPGNYCPLLYPLSCQKRRNVVLHSMKKLHFITQEQYDAACSTSVVIKEPEETTIAPHLKETIRLFLEGVVGKEKLYRGGLTIQTTLDISTQLQAQKVFYEQCTKLDVELKQEIDGALFSIDAHSGEIRALIGGKNFKKSKFNRALQARRQMGSTLKPLIFAAGVQAGMHFNETLQDDPFELMSGGILWKPKNYNGKFAGQVTLAHGLYHSSNIIAIKVLLSVGAPAVIKLAQACNMQGTFHPYPSLALGCVDVTLQEVAGMFNIFANHGVYVEPHAIRWVKDCWGTKIWKHTPQSTRVIDARTSGQVAKVLMLGLKRVRKWFPQKWIESQAISKTGTTNDSRTCWYVGSTPTLTTAVYIGPDDNRSMGHDVYPVHTAFPIWLGFNRDLPVVQKEFSFDPGLQELLIDEFTGATASKESAHVIPIFI